MSRLCLRDSDAQGTRCWPGSVRTESLLLLELGSVEAVFLSHSVILCLTPPPLAWLSSLCCFPPQQATCGQVSTSQGASASECQPLLASGQMVEQQLEKRPLLPMEKEEGPSFWPSHGACQLLSGVFDQ